jgi:hypothetical protein
VQRAAASGLGPVMHIDLLGWLWAGAL